MAIVFPVFSIPPMNFYVIPVSLMQFFSRKQARFITKFRECHGSNPRAYSWWFLSVNVTQKIFFEAEIKWGRAGRRGREETQIK